MAMATAVREVSQDIPVEVRTHTMSRVLINEDNAVVAEWRVTLPNGRTELRTERASDKALASLSGFLDAIRDDTSPRILASLPQP